MYEESIERGRNIRGAAYVQTPGTGTPSRINRCTDVCIMLNTAGYCREGFQAGHLMYAGELAIYR